MYSCLAMIKFGAKVIVKGLPVLGEPDLLDKCLEAVHQLIVCLD
jgi:hypothetical protein